MYLAFNAPHDPRQSPKKYVDMYPLDDVSVPKSFLEEYPYKDEMGCPATLRDEKLAPFPRTEYSVKVHRQEYYAIITHMDEQIGRIINQLKETGQDNGTVARSWIPGGESDDTGRHTRPNRKEISLSTTPQE